jgi:hypothetical protein
MQCKVLLQTFPYARPNERSVEDWLAKTIIKCKADPRISAVHTDHIGDTPITMSRNRALNRAIDLGFDVICMVDSDMNPDLYLFGNQYAHGQDLLAKPFWDTAFDLWWKLRTGCFAAPYMGPPPHENCYFFRWRSHASDQPNFDFRLEQFTREEAAERAGVEEIAALPTGLILIDVASLQKIPQPFFQYEYTDKREIQKASTEDVFFTRNLSIAGVPQYILWDCWAGHWKLKCVGKPLLLSSSHINKEMHEAVRRNQPLNKRLVMWGETDQVNGAPKEIVAAK